MPKPLDDISLGNMDTLDLGGSIDLDLDIDINLDLSGINKIADPLADYEYSGDVEKDAAVEMSVVKAGFIERAKAEAKRQQKATDSEYWLCLCFQSRAQVEAFLKATRWAKAQEKYIDGLKVAKAIGVTLPAESSSFGSVKIDKTFADLSMEV